MMDILFFKPDMYPSVSVCFAAFLLAFSYLLCKRQIFCRHIHPWYKAIVAASGYFKKSAHLADGVFIFMAVDYHVFYTGSRFLFASARKSLISSFSISNLFIYLSFLDSSYCNCVNLLNCWTDSGNWLPSFRGQPGLFSSTQKAAFRWVQLWRLKKSWIFSKGNPNFSAICRWLNPCSLSSNISFSYILMCLYSLAIQIPPYCSPFFHSTIRGLLFSIVRFLRNCAINLAGVLL